MAAATRPPLVEHGGCCARQRTAWCQDAVDGVGQLAAPVRMSHVGARQVRLVGVLQDVLELQGDQDRRRPGDIAERLLEGRIDRHRFRRLQAAGPQGPRECREITEPLATFRRGLF